MKRGRSANLKLAAAAVAAMSFAPPARGATATWTNPAGGAFSVAANWNNGAGPAPVAGTDIFFNLSDAYTVSFTTNPPAVGQLTMNDGDVTWAASGAACTFNANVWSRINGGSLTLGAPGAPVLTFNPWTLGALPGAGIYVRHGSKVNTGPGGAGAGGGATASATPAAIVVDGAGSTLSGSAGIGAGSVGSAGWPATVGTITYSNNASGTFAGSIIASNGLFSVESGADLVGQGAVEIGSSVGSPPITPGAAVTFNVTGAGSTLTQTGSSGITVGSAYDNAATLNVADGGLVVTPGLTINPSGTVDFTGGTLNTKAGVLVNGGTLKRTAPGGNYVSSSSTIMTVQAGGKIDLAGDFDLMPATAFTQTLTVKDANSEFKTGGQLRTGGATVNVKPGGRLAAPSMLIEGSTATIDGTGASLVTTGGITTSYHNGTTPNVVFKNGATGTLGGRITLTFGEMRAESGADVVATGAIDLTGSAGGVSGPRRLIATGAGSTFTQNGSEPITVTGGSLAHLIAEFGGAISTGSGLLTAGGFGRVGANGGTFHHGGDVLVNSGGFVGLTSWAAGRTMTINAGASAGFGDATLTGNTINAHGFGATVSGNAVTLNGGAALTLLNTHATSRFARLHLATDGSAASVHVSADPSGESSQLSTGGPPFPMTANIWGAAGGTVNVTFGPRGTGSFDNGFELASTGTNTTAALSVQGTLYTGFFNAQHNTTAGAVATIDVNGLMMNWGYRPSLIGGAAGSGTATINVNAGGSLQGTGGSPIVLRPSATFNLDGGAAGINALAINGGKLNFNAGSLWTGPNLEITDGGQLDVNENAFVIHDGDVGSAGGGSYDGLTALIQSGYNARQWNGSGIVTSAADAADGLTTVGIATAQQVRGLGLSDTDTFAGHTIDGASVIVMYTYAGDANLDGQIDAGDYGRIDNFVQIAGASGYANGDFNYDGFIDAGDYGIIDNNIQAQGAPLSSGSAPLPAVTAVPEPASLAMVMSAASLMLRRRRQGG